MKDGRFDMMPQRVQEVLLPVGCNQKISNLQNLRIIDELLENWKQEIPKQDGNSLSQSQLNEKINEEFSEIFSNVSSLPHRSQGSRTASRTGSRASSRTEAPSQSQGQFLSAEALQQVGSVPQFDRGFVGEDSFEFNAYPMTQSAEQQVDQTKKYKWVPKQENLQTQSTCPTHHSTAPPSELGERESSKTPSQEGKQGRNKPHKGQKSRASEIFEDGSQKPLDTGKGLPRPIELLPPQLMQKQSDQSAKTVHHDRKLSPAHSHANPQPAMQRAHAVHQPPAAQPPSDKTPPPSSSPRTQTTQQSKVPLPNKDTLVERKFSKGSVPRTGADSGNHKGMEGTPSDLGACRDDPKDHSDKHQNHSANFPPTPCEPNWQNRNLDRTFNQGTSSMDRISPKAGRNNLMHMCHREFSQFYQDVPRDHSGKTNENESPCDRHHEVGEARSFSETTGHCEHGASSPTPMMMTQPVRTPLYGRSTQLPIPSNHGEPRGQPYGHAMVQPPNAYDASSPYPPYGGACHNPTIQPRYHTCHTEGGQCMQHALMQANTVGGRTHNELDGMESMARGMTREEGRECNDPRIRAHSSPPSHRPSPHNYGTNPPNPIERHQQAADPNETQFPQIGNQDPRNRYSNQDHANQQRFSQPGSLQPQHLLGWGNPYGSPPPRLVDIQSGPRHGVSMAPQSMYGSTSHHPTPTPHDGQSGYQHSPPQDGSNNHPWTHSQVPLTTPQYNGQPGPTTGPMHASAPPMAQHPPMPGYPSQMDMSANQMMSMLAGHTEFNLDAISQSQTDSEKLFDQLANRENPRVPERASLKDIAQLASELRKAWSWLSQSLGVP